MKADALKVSIQQTADLIMYEVRASCPCSERHVRNWLIEQCAFDDTHMDDAVDMLVESGKLEVDEDGTFDLAPYISASIRARQ